MSLPITLDDVRRAEAEIAKHVVHTPLRHARALSEQLDTALWLKYENLQYTGSFKERGASFKLASLSTAERQRGVIAMSAGNHAQGLACHAARLGIPATIVMPEFTPYVKVQRTRELGAEVILHGAGFDEAAQKVQDLVAERGLYLVHPYDDPQIMAGQGTIALEMLRQQPDLDVLVVPIGGGGLISGIALAATEVKPTIKVYGVQTERYPSMYAALRGTTARFGASSLADGIAVKAPGALPLAIIKERVEDVLLVNEAEIEDAVLQLLQRAKTMTEGAGAAGFAAVVRNQALFQGKNVGVVLCGGNIDPLVLSSIIQRGMVRADRLVRLLVTIRDVAGSLAKMTALVAETGASIVEVHHQRAFTTASVESTVVELILLTRGPEHRAEILSSLIATGYEARVLAIEEGRA
jgi:threonine dehydratase